MARKRAEFQVLMVLKQNCEPLDSEQAADAVAECFKSDAVENWATQVRQTIEEARRCSRQTPFEEKDPNERKKEELKAQIAELTRRLEALEDK